MTKWLKKNNVELVLGVGLSLFLINLFTTQDEGMYIISIPLTVIGSLMLYKRHFRPRTFGSYGLSTTESLFDEDDELYEDAKEAVIEAGKASTSYIQRKLRVGYSRAARLMDQLEANGVIGPQIGVEPRTVHNDGK